MFYFLFRIFFIGSTKVSISPAPAVINNSVLLFFIHSNNSGLLKTILFLFFIFSIYLLTCLVRTLINEILFKLNLIKPYLNKIAKEFISLNKIDSLEKLILSLENAYDLLTGLIKIDSVLGNPEEINGSEWNSEWNSKWNSE